MKKLPLAIIEKLKSWYKKTAGTKTGSAIIEIFFIVIWALVIGKGFLNLDENIIPMGREYGMSVATHHFWNHVKECGLCALWEGSHNGGYPALANNYSSLLHPLTMILTLIFGVVNGSKALLIFSLIFAGVAQWWLADELGFSRVTRLWSTFLVMAAGHLAGKIELGLVNMVFSIAMCSLVFPAILHYIRKRTNRSKVLLAVVLASAFLSGQGYQQVALFITSPALFFLFTNKSYKLKEHWKGLVGALGLAALLSAPFWVPFLNNVGRYDKFSHPDFGTLPPLSVSLLHYLINDIGYYFADIMEKLPWPNLYVLFIGWIPIILAIIGLVSGKKKDRRKIIYFAVSIGLLFLSATPRIVRWPGERPDGTLFSDFWHTIGHNLGYFRFPMYFLSMTVPLIIALAGFGLERILAYKKWPKLNVSLSSEEKKKKLSFSLMWVVLIPLIINVQTAHKFTEFYWTPTILHQGVYSVLEELQTDSLQWVEPPWGEQLWMEPGIRMGMKISHGTAPWWIKGQATPAPRLFGSRELVENAGDDLRFITFVENVHIYINPAEEYAAVVHLDGQTTPCRASGTGGRLEVVCENDLPGELVVKEYMWPGWKAWIDGERTYLYGNEYLLVEAPAGTHTYTFRFFSSDVILGLGLLAMGITLCIFTLTSPEEPEVEGPETQSPSPKEN